MSLELVVLVPDKDTEQAIRGTLGHPKKVGLRPIDNPRVIVHPNRDPGVFRNARELLSPFRGDASYALVVLDLAWDGAPSSNPHDLEAQVEKLLKPDWGDRAACVCIDPEVENWIWSDSPHVAKVLGWSDLPSLRAWLETNALWSPGLPKPPEPKAAFELSIRKTRTPKSSAIFGQLAARVSLSRCSDPAFGRLCSILRGWFPATPTPAGDG